LEFIPSQLQAIRMLLREIEATADLDRRNTRSMYDNLAAEMARGLGELDVKIGSRIDGLAMPIEDRFNHLIEASHSRPDLSYVWSMHYQCMARVGRMSEA
jgi:hypothetical protein